MEANSKKRNRNHLKSGIFVFLNKYMSKFNKNYIYVRRKLRRVECRNKFKKIMLREGGARGGGA